MTPHVIDASVVIKWFVDEIHAEAAQRLQEDQYELFAPDLLWPECGNILWEKVRHGELTLDEARLIRGGLEQQPISAFPSRLIIEPALEVAFDASREQIGQVWLIKVPRVEVMDLNLGRIKPQTGIHKDVHSEEAERAALASPLPIHKDARHEADIAGPQSVDTVGAIVAHAVSLDQAEDPIEVINQQWIGEWGRRGGSERVDQARTEKWDLHPESLFEPRGKAGDWTGNACSPVRSASSAAKDSHADGGTDQHPARLEEMTPRPEVGVMMVVVWRSNHPGQRTLLRRRIEGFRSKQRSPRGLTTHDFPFLCGVCHSPRPPFVECVQSSV
jgi:predicted nucleic acid-binding protein